MPTKRSKKVAGAPVKNEDYKLTFSRLLIAICNGENIDSRGTDIPRFRNRITKEAMPFRGEGTFEQVGFPSRGSVANIMRSRLTTGKADEQLLLPRSYLGIWLWLHLVVDSQGKGFIDPIDPEQRELQTLFPSYRDLMRLHVGDMPSAQEIVTDFLDDADSDRKTLLMMLQMLDPERSGAEDQLYKRGGSMANRKEALRQIKRLLALYCAEHDTDFEDLPSHLTSDIEEREERDATKECLKDAIADINSNKAIDIEQFAIAIPVFARKLTSLAEQPFDSVEAFLCEIGWLEDIRPER